MDGYLINGSLGMPRGSLLRIDEGAGVLIYVWEGELWLTQEGSPKDHMLHAGQWFRLDRDGAALVHACRRSMVSLSVSSPDAEAPRITLQRSDMGAPAVLHQGSGSRMGRVLRRLLDSVFSPRPASVS